MAFVLGVPVNMAMVWLVAMVVFLVIEALVPGLVSLWFALGALAAVLAAALNAPIWLQLVWFFVVSVAALWLTRPLVKKFINSKVQPTNADAVIGRECLVIEDIDNIRATGRVKVGGMEWTARSEKDDVKFSSGAVVTAVAIEGVKLIVK
ncbi:MAG: NfeD family protein [Oscillospiraceae bacterium]|nr:NfeD family protein [Oscillospiraceae bacterium]